MTYPFDVVDLPETDHVEVGDRAPDFTRPLVNREFWEDVALLDLTAEGPVVLVFYPMDGTGSATYTWIRLRERSWDERNARVVGVSISTPYEHIAFIEDHDLPYQLFSDPGNGVAERYGVVHDHHGMNGISGARPAVFLLDTDRTVRYAWVASAWPDRPDYGAIKEAIDALG